MSEKSMRDAILRILNDEEPDPAASFLARIRFDDIATFIAGELVAIPFAFNGVDSFMKGDYRSGLFAYAVALPTGIGGLTFHFWKRRVGSNIRIWMPRLLLPVALTLAFIYIIGPELYRRATGPLPAATVGPPTTEVESPFSHISRWDFLRLERPCIFRIAASTEQASARQQLAGMIADTFVQFLNRQNQFVVAPCHFDDRDEDRNPRLYGTHAFPDVGVAIHAKSAETRMFLGLTFQQAGIKPVGDDVLPSGSPSNLIFIELGHKIR